MLETLTALFVRGVEALESIAKSLQGAKIAEAATTTAAAPASPAPAPAQAAAPASAAAPAPATGTAKTLAEVKKIALEHASKKGRPFVGSVFEKFAVKKTEELKAEQYDAFIAALGPLEPASDPNDI